MISDDEKLRAIHAFWPVTSNLHRKGINIPWLSRRLFVVAVAIGCGLLSTVLLLYSAWGGPILRMPNEIPFSPLYLENAVPLAGLFGWGICRWISLNYQRYTIVSAAISAGIAMTLVFAYYAWPQRAEFAIQQWLVWHVITIALTVLAISVAASFSTSPSTVRKKSVSTGFGIHRQ